MCTNEDCKSRQELAGFVHISQPVSCIMARIANAREMSGAALGATGVVVPADSAIRTEQGAASQNSEAVSGAAAVRAGRS